MTTDAIAATGSIAGAVILLGGTVAALMQLKHLRLTYQIESYLAIFEQLNRPEMVLARRYVESLVLDTPEKVNAVFENGIDQRILQIGGFCQTVARLINLGIADRKLFVPFIFMLVPIWRALRPIVEEDRRRSGVPRWLDVEVLLYNNRRQLRVADFMRGYPAEVMNRVHFPEFIESYREQSASAVAPVDSQ